MSSLERQLPTQGRTKLLMSPFGLTGNELIIEHLAYSLRYELITVIMRKLVAK